MARQNSCMSNQDFLQKAKIKSPHLVPLEKYVRSSLPVLTKCSVCGHEWPVRASHLLCGDIHCPVCSRNKRTKTHEVFKNQLFLKNPSLELLSVYKNDASKVKVKCKICGYENFAFAGNLLKQGGCKKCGGKIKSTNEEIILKFNAVHGDLFDYSKVDYKDTKTPVEIICRKHGSFMQRPDVHLSGCGCRQCFAEKEADNTTSFIMKAHSLYGAKYDYSKVRYIDSYTPVEIICKKHGSFMQRPNNHLNGNGCPVCKESLGERFVRDFLTRNKLNFEAQKSFADLFDKSFKNKLKYDFYVKNYNLLIEFNGIQHYAFNNFWHKNIHDFHKSIHRDWLKRKYASKHKFNFLVISYKEIDNIESILKSRLKEGLTKCDRCGADIKWTEECIPDR